MFTQKQLSGLLGNEPWSQDSPLLPLDRRLSYIYTPGFLILKAPQSRDPFPVARSVHQPQTHKPTTTATQYPVAHVLTRTGGRDPPPRFADTAEGGQTIRQSFRAPSGRSYTTQNPHNARQNPPDGSLLKHHFEHPNITSSPQNAGKAVRSDDSSRFKRCSEALPFSHLLLCRRNGGGKGGGEGSRPPVQRQLHY